MLTKSNQILQEVATARYVLIAYGSIEIDGYTFYLGVELLTGLYDTRPDLQSLIRLVTYLIRGAIFRPKGSRRVSQDICLLGELINIYYTYKATLHPDKVYALLGISSNNLSKASLSPNYNIPQKDLFKTLTRFLLYKEIFVKALPNKKIAVIKSEGYILSKVSSIQINISQNSGQGVDVILRNILDILVYTRERSNYWTLQPLAKSIIIGDIICLL